jgi:hypothetical protein
MAQGNVLLDAKSSGISYSQAGRSSSLIEVVNINDGKSTGKTPEI